LKLGIGERPRTWVRAGFEQIREIGVKRCFEESAAAAAVVAGADEIEE
jgi:hypothetical protein